MSHNFKILFFAFFLLWITGCVSPKKVIYFNNLTDSLKGGLSNAKTNFDAPIQKNDLLSISIGGSNTEDLVALNSGSGIGSGIVAGTTSKSFGYLVDEYGKIQLPFVGKITAAGLTRVQLEDTITTLMQDYTKNPVVNIKFLNYNFSILGEVNRPGKFDMEDRTTILQAISLAGDLTTLAKRNNILVIREVNGKREFGRVDLLSKDVFKSPYFYLKTNDVVYVEPVRSKFLTRTGAPQYIGLVAAGLTLLLTILNFSKK
jgi:polysaccharide export outer membrane protein